MDPRIDGTIPKQKKIPAKTRKNVVSGLPVFSFMGQHFLHFRRAKKQ